MDEQDIDIIKRLTRLEVTMDEGKCLMKWLLGLNAGILLTHWETAVAIARQMF